MFIVFIILGLIFSQLIEYSLHRFYLHNPKNKTKIDQHHSINNPSYLIISASIILLLPFSIFLTFLISFIYGLIFILSGAIYTFFSQYVHMRIHSPQNTYLENTRFFTELKKQHKTHHTYPETNFGIGSGFIDVLMNTYKNSK